MSAIDNHVTYYLLPGSARDSGTFGTDPTEHDVAQRIYSCFAVRLKTGMDSITGRDLE